MGGLDTDLFKDTKFDGSDNIKLSLSTDYFRVKKKIVVGPRIFIHSKIKVYQFIEGQ